MLDFYDIVILGAISLWGFGSYAICSACRGDIENIKNAEFDKGVIVGRNKVRQEMAFKTYRESQSPEQPKDYEDTFKEYPNGN